MLVRRAKAEDVPQLLALARDGFAESRYHRYEFHPAKAAMLIELPGVIVLVAVDDEDKPVGFLAGVVTQHFFADMIYATNIGLFVSQNRRGSRAAYNLIRTFERVAREQGAREVMLGVTAGGVNARRTAAFYNRLGFQTVGALTVKYIGG